jgi:hypothetical protein
VLGSNIEREQIRISVGTQTRPMLTGSFGVFIVLPGQYPESTLSLVEITSLQILTNLFFLIKNFDAALHSLSY